MSMAKSRFSAGATVIAALAIFAAVTAAAGGTGRPQLRQQPEQQIVAPSLVVTNFEAAFIAEHLFGDAQGDWLADHLVRGACPTTDGVEILWGRADKARTYVLARGLAAPGAPNEADYVELLRILNDAPLCRFPPAGMEG